MLSEQEKELVAKALLGKLGKYKCPMCGNESFSIVQQYNVKQMRPFDKDGVSPMSIGVPFIMAICKNCGFMSNHNMFALGLMDENMSRGMLNLKR